jgi:hypothetical protein
MKSDGALRYMFCGLLTPWSRVLLEKPTGSQLVKKFAGANFELAYDLCTNRVDNTV